MDNVCPICLQTIDNRAILDCCKHCFCKKCIMSWMKKEPTCPLCKRKIGVIISDILSSSQYTQYLPNGDYLYSDYSPHRKMVYTFQLEPLPNYEGEIHPSDADRCPILKEWVRREIETLQPGTDSTFFVSLVIEGLHRYSSRSDLITQRIQDLLGNESKIFLRELESCVNTRAKTLEEFDDCIEYCFPSRAEQIGDLSVKQNFEKDYSALITEYKQVSAALADLLNLDPKLEELASSYRKKLSKKRWASPTRRHHKHKKETKPVIQSDYDYRELYDY